MRSPADAIVRADPALASLLALVLVACAADGPPLSPSGSASPPDAASTTPSTTDAASATPALTLPDPGRPWDAATILDEMAASTRPDGVPAELRTGDVAQAVADAIWTVDGAAWDTFSIGGFCGSTTCMLEVAGTHLGRVGDDAWTFEIDPATAGVTVTEASVRSLPAELVEALDAMARHLTAGELDGMLLGTARWLPPPEVPDRYALSYRSGGEEGSCTRELVLDAAGGGLVEADDPC